MVFVCISVCAYSLMTHTQEEEDKNPPLNKCLMLSGRKNTHNSSGGAERFVAEHPQKLTHSKCHGGFDIEMGRC